MKRGYNSPLGLIKTFEPENRRDDETMKMRRRSIHNNHDEGRLHATLIVGHMKQEDDR